MAAAIASIEPGRGLRGVIDDLRALGKSGRGLWLIYAIKFLESVAFFAIYNLLAVYLSEDLGYGDVAASGIAGTWLTAIAIVTFISGFVADSMGIRRALVISVISCLLGRALLASSTLRPVALAGLAVMTWGVASMLPTMTAAVRAFTDQRTVSFGFSFFYVMMNVGALVAPLTVAALRERIRQPRAFSLGPVTMTMSSSQLTYAIATGATLLALVLAAWVPEPRPAEGKRESPLAILKAVVVEKAFWRFMLLVGLLAIVLLVFQHAHLTWPKYAMREFGREFPFARYWAINPAMVILLTPIVTAIARRFDAFKCLVFGSMISASSILAMAASTSVTASVVFIVMLSLGEAIWSPRLYEYATVIAPKGREASYMGLSRLPLFLAKLVAGFSSGFLLARYCPETGERQSQLMWGIIGGVTVAAPLTILALRRVIQPERSDDEGAEEAPAEEAATAAAPRAASAKTSA